MEDALALFDGADEEDGAEEEEEEEEEADGVAVLKVECRFDACCFEHANEHVVLLHVGHLYFDDDAWQMTHD
jgi:hypothetical protein